MGTSQKFVYRRYCSWPYSHIELTPTRKRLFLLCISIGIVLFCLLLMLCVAGFHYELKKFRSFLVVIVLVLLFQYIIADVVRYVCEALYSALRKRRKVQLVSDLGRTAGDPAPDPDALLRLRLASYQSQMIVSPAHRNESLNLKYKLISNELWLYGKYFFLLLLVVVGSRDYLAYYNTRTLKTVFHEKRLDDIGLFYLFTVQDLNKFLERIIVMAINDGKGYDGEPMPESGWMQYGLGKLLGVVRLRQVRRAHKYMGLTMPHFAEQDYRPSWKLPFQHLHYIGKYWRVYEPWMQHRQASSWLMQQEHRGHLHDYDEDNGYVVLLARDFNNSLKILNYLRNSSWLDDKTTALFIDFTLYNVDSNIFSVCTVLIEQTPFGSLLSTMHVQSVELMMNIDHISAMGLLVLLLYVLQLIQFAKLLFLNAWYRTEISRSAWNYVDWLIVALNIVAFVLVTQRESKVAELLARFEKSLKLEFIDFRIPAQIDYLITLTLGFLICLTTLRLWKVLQFAKAFRLFTRTLFKARMALMTLSLVIIVFLFAFGSSSYVINGNNTERFTRLAQSFTSSMSLSFGFSSTVSPQDLTYGGITLGFLLYLLLMFVIAILLINIFITLICDYFSRSKDTPDEGEAAELSFWDFIKVEYARCFKCCRECGMCFQTRAYDRKKGTLKQNIDGSVRRVEKQVARRQLAGRANKGSPYGRRLRSLSEVRMLAKMLNSQVAFLKRYEKRLYR